jgi:hypothetical protein
VLYRNHRDEWLEFDAKLISPATSTDYIRDIEYYTKRIRLYFEKLEQMAAEWQAQAEQM